MTSKKRIGRFELLEKLGSGGMGEVYRARSVGAEGFSKTVAIKTIYPDHANEARHRAAFVREAKIVADLVHPNIVQVHELGETRDGLYIAMEFVHGIDLASVLDALSKRRERLAPELAVIILFDVLQALAHAHERVGPGGTASGVVHRDVTPANILISTAGFAKLCDFGIARVLEKTGTYSGLVKGKLGYMAPEQLRNEPVDARTDLYSLGVCFYEMLTCRRLLRRPGVVGQLEELEQGHENPLDGQPTKAIPAALLAMLRPALEYDPARRYRSAGEFLMAIEPYVVEASPRSARVALAELVSEFVSPLPEETDPLPSSYDDSGSRGWSELLERAGDSMEPMNATVRARVTTRQGKRIWRARQLKYVALVAGLFVLALIPVGLTLSAYDTQPAVPSEIVDIDTTKSKKRRPGKRRARRRKKPAASGRLALTVRPWANVTVDDRRLGRAAPTLSHKLSVGDHVVRLDGPGGRKAIFRVTIVANQTVTREVDLH